MGTVFYWAFVIIFVFICIFFVFLSWRKRNRNLNQKKDYYTQAVYKKENLGTKLRDLFMGKQWDEKEFAVLEETLISSDIGPAVSNEVIERLRKENIRDTDGAIEFLKRELASFVKEGEVELKEGTLNIFLVLGVNGVGKTTSIAKIASYYLKQGKKVLLAAGDTFRAAATEQLTRWAKELDIPIIKQGEGADPASVVFDAIDSAKSRKVDLLIIDTAGRLHNKKNLMEELKKIDRIIESKGCCEKKNLLVIDSTTGQNALLQAEAFHGAVGVDKIMLTKYDALSKGGIVFHISKKLGIPFCFIGTGERLENIERFEKERFVQRIFG